MTHSLARQTVALTAAALALVTGGCGGGASNGPAVTDAQLVRSGEFRAWNWINAPGAPKDLSAYGIRPLIKVTHREIYLPAQQETWQRRPPCPEAVYRFARTIPDGAFVVTDIEGWPLDGENARVAAQRWVELNRMLRTAAGGKDIAIGQFNALRSPRLAIESRQTRRWWLDYNRTYRKGVLASLDADCTHLYARGPVWDARDPIRAWREMANRTRALHDELAPDKPFIPFISPRWWARGAGPWGRYLPLELWRTMLDWCEANADGVIVYHGHAASPSWSTFRRTEHWKLLAERAERRANHDPP